MQGLQILLFIWLKAEILILIAQMGTLARFIKTVKKTILPTTIWLTNSVFQIEIV